MSLFKKHKTTGAGTTADASTSVGVGEENSTNTSSLGGTVDAASNNSQNEVRKPIVEVRNLNIDFTSDSRVIHAVQGISFDIYPGEAVAIVGESGSGKSTSAHAIIGLLPGTGKVSSGSIKLNGKELVGMTEKEYEKVRGSQIGLVPQDPMSNLNPVWNIAFQVKEALKANNVDVSREKFRIVSDSQKLQHVANLPDSELFLSSEKRDDLLNVIIGELIEMGYKGEKLETARREIYKHMQPGSTTREDLYKNLVERNISEERAIEIACKYVTGSNIDDRALGLLSEAGLNKMQDRIRLYPHEFSGGMRQRVLIAIGLASRPSLLIADEPTSALDVTVQKTILDNLSWLTESLGTALLFITHDLGLAAERAKHLIVMYKGRIVEQGDAIEILKNPKHPYTKRLVATAPGLHSERLVSDKVGITRERSEELRSEESPSSLATSGGPSTELGNNDAIISVQNLTKIFETHRLGKKIPFTAVDNVSFDVKKGTTLGIVGESGSGKSTVANMVLKLLDPTSGEIIIQGKDISHITHRETLKFRRNVQPIFQNPYGSLDPMYSIYRAIMEPLNIHKIGNRKYRDKRTRELLDYVQLPQSILGRYPNELSGGQRQRIAVARALALEPEILVCDEAVSALDVLVQDQVLRLINDLQAELGLTYLFITHDLGVIKQIADDVIVMEHGKVVESRKTMELFQNPEKAYTRELLDAIPGSKLGIGIS